MRLAALLPLLVAASLAACHEVPIALAQAPPHAAPAETAAARPAPQAGTCGRSSIPECQAACDDGGLDACEALADDYATGWRVPLDVARAASLLDRACDGGRRRACERLGDVYATSGTVPDRERAARAFARACLDGDDVADGERASCEKLAIVAPSRALPPLERRCRRGSDFACGVVVVVLRREGMADSSTAALVPALQRLCRDTPGSGDWCGQLKDLGAAP